MKVVTIGFDGIRVPKEYGLLQNYPNPFNPATVIEYELPKREYVSLKVFNLLGNEVVTLADGYEDAGFKSVRLNAENLPTGVYFCRLQTEKFSATKSFILMR